MSKHTPGPWHLSGNKEKGTFIASENGACVAQVDHPFGLVLEDINLMAAAPDLLAALEAFVKWTELPSSMPFEQWHDASKTIGDMANAAIKKATTGETK